jgi:hypothetical protein
MFGQQGQQAQAHRRVVECRPGYGYASGAAGTTNVQDNRGSCGMLQVAYSNSSGGGNPSDNNTCSGSFLIGRQPRNRSRLQDAKAAGHLRSEEAEIVVHGPAVVRFLYVMLPSSFNKCNRDRIHVLNPTDDSSEWPLIQPQNHPFTTRNRVCGKLSDAQGTYLPNGCSSNTCAIPRSPVCNATAPEGQAVTFLDPATGGDRAVDGDRWARAIQVHAGENATFVWVANRGQHKLLRGWQMEVLTGRCNSSH